LKDHLPLNPRPFRKLLLNWYERNKRDLPWRASADPYRVWLSEIMLQQTRVAAVIPYYERFLHRFPTVRHLASAPEEEVLTYWAGLGYYSRARNLQKAARQIVELGHFPTTYDEIRGLAGVGDYTAAAIASIALDLPHSVLDGNVMRVLTRLENDASDIASGRTRQRLQKRAQELLDTRHPGLANQAIMELGATVCTPKTPSCPACPVSSVCEAYKAGTERQLPVKGRKMQMIQEEKTLLLVSRETELLMWQRPADSKKLQGFWELPEQHQLPGAVPGRPLGEFRHSITNHNYRIQLLTAHIDRIPKGFCFLDRSSLEKLPVTTATKKALRCFSQKEDPKASHS